MRTRTTVSVLTSVAALATLALGIGMLDTAHSQDMDSPIGGPLVGAGLQPQTRIKILTPTETDVFTLDVKAGETIGAYVESDAFDPILQLVDPAGKVVREVDDQGNHSQLMEPMLADGTWEIRVSAYQNRAGGKYVLRFERWPATAIPSDTPTIVTINPEHGAAHLRLELTEGEVVVPWISTPGFRIQNVYTPGYQVLGFNMAIVAETDGTYHARVYGPVGQPFEVRVQTATIRPLVDDAEQAGTLSQGGLDIWEVTAATGNSFREIAVTEDRPTVAVLTRKPDGTRLPGIPVSQKVRRDVVVMDTAGTWQIWVRNYEPRTADYRIRVSDPTRPVAFGTTVVDRLDIGGSHFWSFDTQAGQLLDIRLQSDQFDALMTLRDDGISHIATNDDGGGDLGLGSRIVYLSPKGGPCRLQVQAVGFGGGGEYRLTITEREIETLEVGAAVTGALSPGGRAVYRLPVPAGRTLLVSARSAHAGLRVQVMGNDGVTHALADERRDSGHALFPLQLASDTLCTVVVSARYGSRSFRLRVIDDGE